MKLYPWTSPYALVRYNGGTKLAYIPECRRDPETKCIINWRGRACRIPVSAAVRDWTKLYPTMRTFGPEEILSTWRTPPTREQVRRAQLAHKKPRDLAATLIPSIPAGYL